MQALVVAFSVWSGWGLRAGGTRGRYVPLGMCGGYLLGLQELLFPSITDVAVLSVDVSIAIVRVDAECTPNGAACPACEVWSNRAHGFYLWFPADVPSAGRSVVLRLRVRRFTCDNPECARRTFVERVPGLTRRHGQRTERLRSTLASVGLALAGRAGAWLSSVLGVSASRITVLRLVNALPDPEMPGPRVVGVDEYATRKGRHYGTVLVDVEARHLVDLLPTGKHRARRPGSPIGPALRSCAGTGRRSSPRAPAPVHRRPCRSQTGGISGTT